VSTSSPKLLLKRPDGTDPFLRQDFVDNWNKIDAAPGIYVCDSTTRPSWASAQAGRMIFLTDWKQLQYWDGSSWNNERTAVPFFAGGAIFDATVGKNATPVYNIVNITTPRPATLAIMMSATVSCDSRFTQDVYFRANVDGGDLLLGGYSDAIRFTGKSDDSSADMKMTVTALAQATVTAGSHSLKGKFTIGTYNTSVIIRGIKTLAFLGTYNSSQVL
jgi:hypothetical protein